MKRRTAPYPLPLTLAAIFLSAPSLFAQQAAEPPPNNTFTMTTYYPAPFGAYDTIQLVPKSSSFTPPNPCRVGTMYVDSDGKLQYCQNASGTSTWGPIDQVWTQSGNNIYPADTASNPNLKVGIRTTNPERTLDIESSGLAADMVLKATNPAGVSWFYFAADPATGTIKGNPGYQAAIGVGGSQYSSYGGPGAFNILKAVNGSWFPAIIINNSGKVGIGTTNPRVPLDVNRNVSDSLASFNDHVVLRIMNKDGYQSSVWQEGYNNGGLSSAGTYYAASGGTAASPTNITSGKSLGYVAFEGNAKSSGAPFFAGGAVMAALAEQDFSWTSNSSFSAPTSLIFMTANDNSSNPINEKMRITSSGNVGIGTTNPAEDLPWPSPALNISGKRGTLILRTTTTPDDGPWMGIATIRMVGPGSNSVDDWHINMRAQTATTPSTFNIDPKAGSIGDVFTITNTGNVGIGTTNPIKALVVERNSNSGASSVYPAIRSINTLDTPGDGTTTWNQADVQVLAGNGRVDNRLMVRYDSVAMGGEVGTISNHPLYFMTNGQANIRATIDTTGNVGIGTTGPHSKLQVTTGDVYVETQGNGIILRDTNGTGCHRITVDSAGALSAAAVTCP